MHRQDWGEQNYREEYEELQKCMQELFDQPFIDSIFRILKSILLIGNIQFNIDKQDGESIIISDDSIPILNNIADLLSLNFESET